VKHTTLITPLDLSINYNRDAYVGYEHMSGELISGTLDELKLKIEYMKLQDIPELLTDRRKYIVNFNLAYFHVIMEVLPEIFRVRALDPNILFVLHVDLDKATESSIYSYTLDLLDANGIDYFIVGTPVPGVGMALPVVTRMTNFSYMSSMRQMSELSLEASLPDIKLVLDKICEFSAVTSNKRRKVYLSRRKVRFHSLDEGSDYLGYKDDSRLYGEAELEQYLAELGFDIVCPEDFNSFDDQVKLLAETDVLITSTGSGLVNLGFMPEGGLVVELRCELLFGHIGGQWHEPYQMLIGEYVDLSYIKRHTHILISNPDKEAGKMVEALKGLRPLLLAPTRTTLQSLEGQ
jgi:capsular polysaccharide biosynthesis protein